MPFSLQEDSQIAQLRKRGLTWPMIGRRLGHSGDAVRRRHKRLDIANALTEAARFYMDDGPTYDELAAQWNDWLERSVRESKAPKLPDGDSRRVGIICDLHCPYEHRGVLARFVDDGPYDVVAVVGDLLDYESVSSFTRTRDCSMREEVQHGTWALETLSGCAQEVWVTTDNHSRRITTKLMAAGLPPDLLELLKLFSPDIDLFNLMSNGLPNVRIANIPRPVRDGSTITTSFLIQLGDIVLGHPDVARRAPLSSVRAFAEWLRDWEYLAEFSPFRVIGMAHTHQLGIHYARGGHEMQMELGCAVTLEGVQYALEGKRRYRPPVRAYTTLEQELVNGDWVTLFNTVRQVIIRND